MVNYEVATYFTSSSFDIRKRSADLLKGKALVSEAKRVMMEDIEKVLDRGEEFELLVDKTEDLRSPAQDVRQQGNQMRRKLWLRNLKIKLIVLGTIVTLILIKVLTICDGFKC
ncbi:vesicle-associated membrane protein 721-like [Syzygium oleosum]|uniref:vesicle-associated membrane protein 721-like n=1 Tax=Syzygium oleosum TaxID=219896 RepID=UPI0024BA6107|nr:vesicle-associated membrane protein 721-like [Syzygium oleosum]